MRGVADLDDDAFEPPRDLRDGVEQPSGLVLRRRVDADREVALRDAAGDVDRLREAAEDAAREQYRPSGEDEHDDRCHPDDAKRLGANRRIEVVEVEARADDPAPRLEQLHVRDLADRLRRAGLRPQVGHEPGAAPADGRHELDEEPLARGIGVVREVLAVELRPGRVHDHPGVEIVHPEVLLPLVPEPPERVERRPPRVLGRHAPLVREPTVLGEHAVDRLDDGADLRLALREHARLEHAERLERELGQRGEAGGDDEAEAERDGEARD